MASNAQLYYVLPQSGTDDQYQAYNQGHYGSPANNYSKIVIDQDRWISMENMRTGRTIQWQDASGSTHTVRCKIDGQERYMNFAIAPEKWNMDTNRYYDQKEQVWDFVNGFEIRGSGASSFFNLNNLGIGCNMTMPSNTWTIEWFMRGPVIQTAPSPNWGYFYIVDQTNTMALLAQSAPYWGDMAGNYSTSYQSGYYLCPQIWFGNYTNSNYQYNYIHVDNTWNTGTLIHTAFTCNNGAVTFFWHGNKRYNCSGLGSFGTNIEFVLGMTTLLNNNGCILPSETWLESIRVSDNVRYTDSFTPPQSGAGWTVDDHTLRLVQGWI